MLFKESTKCSVCNIEARRLLHHVPHQSTFHLLCTNCVLHIHKQSFCHTCFHVYPSATPSICPVCSNSNGSNTPVLKLLKEVDGFKIMDKESAKKLMAAAKIASQLMNAAVLKAKAEAESKAKEAAEAREKAKKALEKLGEFMGKEKKKKKENGVDNLSNGKGVESVENEEGLTELTAEIMELMMDVDENDDDGLSVDELVQ